MSDDWDLQAVVRGCSATSSSFSSTTSSSFSSTTTTTSAATNVSLFADFHPQSYFSGNLFHFPDNERNVIGDLHELYQPFCPKSPPVSSISASKVQSQEKQLRQPELSPASSQTNRSKRRKNQLKKVCQVPVESLSSDVWSWRKYGQKPIKGSPYPRGYYRCSSSKGCLARKQVERNRSNPEMFIVTYTSEHNHPVPTHRNSLAGSTRPKSLTSQTVTTSDSSKASSTKPSCSSPATSIEEEFVHQSSVTENRAYGEDLLEEDDDFFEGLEEFACPVTGDCYSENFPVNFTFPWLVNNAATTAGSG